jgi:CoA:oxalate CoA-transferase
LPPPGCPAFQGEHNEEILAERDVPKAQIDDMKRRRILLSRKTAVGAFD